MNLTVKSDAVLAIIDAEVLGPRAPRKPLITEPVRHVGHMESIDFQIARMAQAFDLGISDEVAVSILAKDDITGAAAFYIIQAAHLLSNDRG
jgi:hypothetical protein